MCEGNFGDNTKSSGDGVPQSVPPAMASMLAQPNLKIPKSQIPQFASRCQLVTTNRFLPIFAVQKVNSDAGVG